MAPTIVAALQELIGRGYGTECIALSLDLLVEALLLRTSVEDASQLVMTAPTESGAYHRDTRVVVTDLFKRADLSVTVAGYAVYQGKKIFEELAVRMELIHITLGSSVFEPHRASRGCIFARLSTTFRTRIQDTSLACGTSPARSLL